MATVGAVLIAPPAIVFFSAWLFNHIIETDRIDFNFLADAKTYIFSDTPTDPSKVMRFIPPSVILALYSFGLAACLLAVMGAASTAYAGSVISRHNGTTMAHLMFALILAGAAGVGLVYFCNTNLPVSIARELIQKTLYFLPECEKTATHTCPYGIGNTGNSLLRIVAVIMAIAAAAGFSYWMAVVSIAVSGRRAAVRKDALRNATILAAMAFLMTVVATHLLFQPGAEMISAAYAPEIVNDKLPEAGKAALANYASLRSAMTLYWGVIFSLALATAYCPAAAYLGLFQSTGSGQDIWKLAKSLIPVIAPALASGFIQSVEEFVNVVAKGSN